MTGTETIGSNPFDRATTHPPVSTLLSGTLDSSFTEQSRRGWTTFTSFGVQALAMAILLVLPLLRPTGLPSFHQLSTPISLGQPLPDSPAIRPHSGMPITTARTPEFFFRRPSPIPSGQPTPVDDGAPQISGSGPYLPGVRPGDSQGMPNLFATGTRPVMPTPPPAAATHSIRLSHMSEGNLIRKVQPAYPPLARSARIQGQVVLQAVISRQGSIENLSVVTGHPMLVQAAIDAVRQWRYRPYILNNEPVEVETQITVNFSLAGN
jgi:periplasmic protein TonB